MLVEGDERRIRSGTLTGQKMGTGAEQVERSAPETVDAYSERQKDGR